MKKFKDYTIIKPNFTRMATFSDLDFLISENPHLKFLDLGSGDFYLGKYPNVDGYDTQVREPVYHKPKLYDGQKLPVKAKYYDFVISNNVIEHVEDKGSHLIEIKRVLKDDGVIIMTMPAPFWYTARYFTILYYFHRFILRKKMVHGLPKVYQRVQEERRMWSFHYYRQLFKRQNLCIIYYENYGNILSAERRFNILNSFFRNFRLRAGTHHLFILKKNN